MEAGNGPYLKKASSHTKYFTTPTPPRLPLLFFPTPTQLANSLANGLLRSTVAAFVRFVSSLLPPLNHFKPRLSCAAHGEVEGFHRAEASSEDFLFSGKTFRHLRSREEPVGILLSERTVRGFEKKLAEHSVESVAGCSNLNLGGWHTFRKLSSRKMSPGLTRKVYLIMTALNVVNEQSCQSNEWKNRLNDRDERLSQVISHYFQHKHTRHCHRFK